MRIFKGEPVRLDIPAGVMRVKIDYIHGKMQLPHTLGSFCANENETMKAHYGLIIGLSIRIQFPYLHSALPYEQVPPGYFRPTR